MSQLFPLFHGSFVRALTSQRAASAACCRVEPRVFSALRKPVVELFRAEWRSICPHLPACLARERNPVLYLSDLSGCAVSVQAADRDRDGHTTKICRFQRCRMAARGLRCMQGDLHIRFHKHGGKYKQSFMGQSSAGMAWINQGPECVLKDCL